MRDDVPRTERHAKDPGYEALLERVNADILHLGAPATAATSLQRSCVFITGLPRCGTTLLHQVLAASGAFGYVTNLNARFHANPAFGARVQAILSPLLPRGPFSFRSQGGRTENWYEPHEFGYFWERHFPLEEHHQPSPDDLAAVDVARLAGELAALEAALAKPLVFKNLVIDLFLPFVAQALPTARFIRIRRPLLDVASSIYSMRLEYFGREDGWFSIRPRDAAALSGSSAADQIAHQIATLSRALDGAREAIGEARWLEIEYGDLCRDPRRVIRLALDLAAAGSTGPDEGEVPLEFRPAARAAVPPAIAHDLRRALHDRGLSA